MARDAQLPEDVSLDEDEVVLHSAKDWGVATRPFVLTNRRLICPAGPVGHAVAVIPLSDVQEVRLRKPFIGYATLGIDRRTQPPVSIPAHINGERIRADIATAVDAANPPVPAAGSEASNPDRYERLRRVGQLRASGVLTEAEFEQEKARILKEP